MSGSDDRLALEAEATMERNDAAALDAAALDAMLDARVGRGVAAEREHAHA